MHEKRKALGKGLEELGISDLLSSIQTTQSEEGMLKSRFLAVTSITPNPYQPRKHFSASGLKQLAESIKAQGLLQPVVVRPGKSANYELIAGERRLRACQLIGMKTIPAIVKNISDQACLVLAVIENIQRQDLNVVELAESLHALAAKYGMTHAEVGGVVGKSRAAVSNLIRLLQLQAEVKQWLVEGLLEMGHARCLLSLPPQEQLQVAKEIIDKQLPVREVELLVRLNLGGGASKPRKTAGKSQAHPAIESLCSRFSHCLGKAVMIKPKGDKPGGVFSFRYESEQELESMLAKLSSESSVSDRSPQSIQEEVV